MEVNYVTNNWAKIASAKKYLEPMGIVVNQVKMDCVEIQADNVKDVAIYSSKWAAERVNGYVIKNDCGLKIKALNDFPNAYTHYVEESIGVKGILKLMEGVKDRSAVFTDYLALTTPSGETICFENNTKGTISLEESGTFGWGYDMIFIPDGKDKTFANFEDDERWELWDQSGFNELIQYLDKLAKSE